MFPAALINSMLTPEHINSIVEKQAGKVNTIFESLAIKVPILNRDYTTLVLKSSMLADQHFQFHYLADNLIRLMPKGDPIHTAQNMGMILNSIDFREYFQSTDDQQIID